MLVEAFTTILAVDPQGSHVVIGIRNDRLVGKTAGQCGAWGDGDDLLEVGGDGGATISYECGYVDVGATGVGTIRGVCVRAYACLGPSSVIGCLETSVDDEIVGVGNYL